MSKSAMGMSAGLTPLVAGIGIPLLLALLVQAASAQGAPKAADGPPCICAHCAHAQGPACESQRSGLAEHKVVPDENDEIAALEAIRIALTEVGDGNTFAWHRRHGRLSGLVQPTTSFKDSAGRVCRHILLIMTAGDHVGKAEGVACRGGDGRWQLGG
jgi:hypothetical protein